MPDENRSEGSGDDRRDDESGHTGHDKYRPVNLQSHRSDPYRSRRSMRGDTSSGESESGGRNATGTGPTATTGTERGAHRYGPERRAGDHRKREAGGDAHRTASDRHRSGEGGRPSDRRQYDSRTVEGNSSGSPHAGSQRGSHREEGAAGRFGGHRGGDRSGPVNDQASLGDQYRYAGDRGRSQRDRRYGSRRDNSAQRDPRRE